MPGSLTGELPYWGCVPRGELDFDALKPVRADCFDFKPWPLGHGDRVANTQLLVPTATVQSGSTIAADSMMPDWFWSGTGSIHFLLSCFVVGVGAW